MRFASEIPVEALAARPWAKPTVIGPPLEHEHNVGSLMTQVDEQTPLGRAFRFFAEPEDDDIKSLAAGNLVEFVVYAYQMVPVSISVPPYHPPAIIDPGCSTTPEYPFKPAALMSIQQVQFLIDENIEMRKELGRT